MVCSVWTASRVRVERQEGTSHWERLFFTDYGHYGHFGPTEENVFRKLSFQQRMNPVEVVDFHFRMPADDQALQSVREELARHAALLARIERIQPSQEEAKEEIVVSFWRADSEDTSECFSLSKIV